jgi:hypothetical protein
VIDTLREFMADRTNAVTIPALLLVPVSVWFMVRCLLWHRERRPPWDTASFALNFAGGLAALWFIAEAILNVSDPPNSWRIYVIVLSLALLHHSASKCIDAWTLSRKPPPKGGNDASATPH